MYINPKCLVAAFSGAFSNCVIAKMEFWVRKKFWWGLSIQLWYRSIFPRSKGLGMGPTTTTPKIIKFWNYLPSGWVWRPSKFCEKSQNGKFVKSNVLASPCQTNDWLFSPYGFFEKLGYSFSDLKTLQNANFKNFLCRYIFALISGLSFPRFLLHSYHNLLYS